MATVTSAAVTPATVAYNDATGAARSDNDAAVSSDVVPAAAAITTVARSASHHGLAIGFAVTAGIYCATGEGAGSGGVFNPSIGVATVVVNWWTLGRDVVPAWIYVVGPFAGAIGGAMLFLSFNVTETGVGAASTGLAGAAGRKVAPRSVKGPSMFDETTSMFSAAASPYGAYGGGTFNAYSTL